MTKLTFVFVALLLVALGACNAPSNNSGVDPSARSASTPGWTGRTLVMGTSSSVAGAAAATYDEQKWQIDRGR